MAAVNALSVESGNSFYEFVPLRSCYAMGSVSKIKAIAIDSVGMQKRECLYTAPFPLKDAFFLTYAYPN
jgi:hypothetical protein